MKTEKKRAVSCSGCGNTDINSLAVVLAGCPSFMGMPLRILVYCRSCRDPAARRAPFALAVPLADASEELLLSWYRDDNNPSESKYAKTESDPEVASALVFGEARPDFIEKAKAAIAARHPERESQS